MRGVLSATSYKDLNSVGYLKYLMDELTPQLDSFKYAPSIVVKFQGFMDTAMFDTVAVVTAMVS